MTDFWIWVSGVIIMAFIGSVAFVIAVNRFNPRPKKTPCKQFRSKPFINYCECEKCREFNRSFYQEEQDAKTDRS